MVRINFADIEERENLPKGKYHVLVTEGSVEETGPDTKHPNNPYWNLEFTVQDGEYEGRKEFTNLQLPPYEVYGLFNLLRATVGQHDIPEEELEPGSEQDVDVELEDLIDLELVIHVRPQKKNPEYNEVSRMEPYDPDSWAENDLLP